MLHINWADANQMIIPADPPLSAYRKKKLETIKPEIARRCSLCAELLLNKTVRMEDQDFPLPLKIETDAFGKPFFVGHEYEFCLSHSSHYTACALTDFPIGLDLQIRTNCEDRLVRRFFTEREQESIFSANDRNAAFTRLWCRKESFLKAIGTGLRLPLDSFDVSEERPVLRYLGTAYGLREYQTDDLFFSVCAPVDQLPDHISPVHLELP